MKRLSHASNTRAAALPLVLWAVLVVSVVTVAAIGIVDHDIDLESREQRNFAARQAAVSGLAYGLHPKIDRSDPLLSQSMKDGTKLEVQVLSEDARLNINNLLKSGDTSGLAALFRLWGVTVEQSGVVMDSLKDWVDSDNLVSLNGNETHVGNRPFMRVGEMAQVRGMDAVIKAKPDWADYFSVKSSGVIDWQDAPEDLFEAISQLTPTQAQAIVAFRNGPDGIPRTLDDQKIKSADTIAGIVALEDTQKQLLQKKFGPGQVRRVVSRGTIGTIHREVVVVAMMPQDGGRPVYLEWLEK